MKVSWASQARKDGCKDSVDMLVSEHMPALLLGEWFFPVSFNVIVVPYITPKPM